jgi:hypothetical protein
MAPRTEHPRRPKGGYKQLVMEPTYPPPDDPVNARSYRWCPWCVSWSFGGNRRCRVCRTALIRPPRKAKAIVVKRGELRPGIAPEWED